MRAVSVHEAKTHLSRLLVDVHSGEEITIERSGKPIARLVPIPFAVKARAPGKDVIKIHDDFDVMPKGFKRAFGMK